MLTLILCFGPLLTNSRNIYSYPIDMKGEKLILTFQSHGLTEFLVMCLCYLPKHLHEF